MSVSEVLVRLLQREFISGTNLVSLSLKSSRLVIFSRFLFFKDKSFSALRPHSAKNEHGKGNGNFFAMLIECVYLVSVSLQCHAITSSILNKVLTNSSFCISERSS